MTRQRLAELRWDEGLTPEQLGEKVGLSGQTIRRLEAGAHPTAGTAKKIADYFQLKPSNIWPVEEASAA